MKNINQCLDTGVGGGVNSEEGVCAHMLVSVCVGGGAECMSR